MDNQNSSKTNPQASSKEKINMDQSIVTKVKISEKSKNAFLEWQGRFHASIASFSGFLSLEISRLSFDEWVIIQRFNNKQNLKDWSDSQEKKDLLRELKKLCVAENPIEEDFLEKIDLQPCVTEVFVTKVNPEKEQEFRGWFAKIHQIEASFPGFKGVYVQAPKVIGSENWITFLQFDTIENLDNWLASDERKAILLESEQIISSFEHHRVISPFAGWFSSLAEKGAIPPVWKQTMIILLVLYPIVMLELKLLLPHLHDLNHSLATFLGNVISVSLVSWPMAPIAIFFLNWWLAPKKKSLTLSFLGATVVCILYVLEIALFW